jgi:hypothetical protein
MEAVRALPYGRPSDRSVEVMLRERREAKHCDPAIREPFIAALVRRWSMQCR